LRYAAWALVKISGAETPTPIAALVLRKVRLESLILLISYESSRLYWYGYRVENVGLSRIDALSRARIIDWK
jgi:hypothetical protein